MDFEYRKSSTLDYSISRLLNAASVRVILIDFLDVTEEYAKLANISVLFLLLDIFALDLRLFILTSNPIFICTYAHMYPNVVVVSYRIFCSLAYLQILLVFCSFIFV